MSPEKTGPAAVIVLAAGAGTRMKSRTPKILHEIGGRSLVAHALHAARTIRPQELALVVRHERDLVAAHIAAVDPAALVVDQDEIPGTGRAVQAALAALDGLHPAGRVSGTVVVTYGDVPLLTGSLLAELVASHEAGHNAVTVLTAVLADATGYGRILRATDGTVTGIREHKDATDAEREIREINSGIYAFDAAVLRDSLAHVTTENAQGEMYLTDVLGLARAAGGRVAAVVTEDRWQVEGANDRVQLSALGAELNRRTVEAWMRAGVTIVDPATTWIDAAVTLDEDVRLLPNTQLHGSTTVARNAAVGPDTTLTDVQVGEGATVIRTHGSGATIGAMASVGPFTYLRPGTVLGETGKIGAFYETKNVTIGRGSKLSHLGYAGDAEIGEDTNIGCGNITANYDGEKKHRTVIGSGVRTGSNTVFVAPVQVGDGAYSGAGAVIRRDVPPGALVLSVAKQQNAEGWVLEHRPDSVSASLARTAGAATTSSSTPASTEEG
ncbi:MULTISPECIES: bifunctional UDP-N-acetylglucosamine diphosphorylase/glucosamine-1-phosphate N-acetyltransferase GlmU [Micrococcaceae]|uniref:bifunctional UDP-N-acetylglucosamine diphosphorylase/glucosamine-1-phosphate N-acetyltransferase GlmU n=1 Tax=Micrococcaceae TaxID=1268 RepID=UPI001CFFA1E1|nr:MULTISPECIES: bifunctional UDP-N-acetylglucosamine diphosphorylase/glucosamine-1-phosphate N-acetyltransferase GlmU [Micrococcaceae]MCB5280903.1 Bifunctional protein GlmU [Arthrobacter sp. ES1]MDJ0352019.1 bifunctional UDP-N-acetylglucosamine diphosphorylase/glucosamine-1-phosphate N-acetyltransferase GlmU [Pseudarthrobacter sp. PH31-O2]WGZ80262.1 bifunctional UDP-N-acetylglucosamine diphosphorylase/glucosamine-1-phosphate N-acetyltransferase GlmU [Arthrobacter sp. EM1]